MHRSDVGATVPGPPVVDERHERRTRASPRVSFCAGIVASLVLTPVLWSHYLILLPAALIVLGAPRRSFLILALASWAIAPPHGVHLDADLLDRVSSSGPWLAVGVSLGGFLYAALRPTSAWAARSRERRQG